MTRRFAFVLVLFVFIATSAFPVEPEGTLIFELRHYESDVKLKKNVQKQLEHGGLVWGLQENELVIPLVARQYVKPELPHTTRWGEVDEVQLAPGEYRITCIGYEQRELSRNPDKVLSKSAYFNEGVLTFTIRSDRVTKIEVLPRFRKTGKLIKIFVPALHVKVLEDGALVREAVITERTAESIPWDDYVGPLKF